MNRNDYHAARRTYRAQQYADRKAAAERAAKDRYTARRQYTTYIEVTPAERFLRTLPANVQAAITARPVTLGRYVAEGRFPANRRYASSELSLNKRLAIRRALRSMYPGDTRAEQIRQGVPNWKLSA